MNYAGASKRILKRSWQEIFKGRGRSPIADERQSEAEDHAAFPKPNWAPDWQAILSPEKEQWDTAVAEAKQGPKILIATSYGGNVATTPIESLLGVALTLRGANVEFLLCDRFLPACAQVSTMQYAHASEFVAEGPQKTACQHCFEGGMGTYHPLGLKIHLYSQLVTAEERKEAHATARAIPIPDISRFTLAGMAVGEHATAGALRFFSRGDFEGEGESEPVLRRYLEASLLTAYATQRLIETSKYECAVFNHGIYVPSGVVGEACRRNQLRLVNWYVAYRKQCSIFSHGDTYHHTLLNEPTSCWENMEWSDELDQEIMGYLKSRIQGSRDWIWFHEYPQEDLDMIAQELHIDFKKPTIGLLTNVIWDAQLHYPANAFPNMLDWLLKTVKYFVNRPDLQLVIRAHPAELTGNQRSRQFVVDELKKAFPELPSNIFVIPPDSRISTYAVMMQCDSVIIYGTKTGVELSSLGIPIIVAGEAWIRNKGLTVDVQSQQQYYEVLDALPRREKMDAATTCRARMYAYHFFFRRMIPFSMLDYQPGWPPYKVAVRSLKELRPGADPGLDVVCRGILQGSPFIFPAELVSQSGR